MLNTTQAHILDKFKSLVNKSPEYINVDLFYDDNQIMVDFPSNDETDLVIYFNSYVSTPDDYSVLCEDTKYHKAVYASQYDNDLDEDCNVDLSFMLKHIENFIVSEEYRVAERKLPIPFKIRKKVFFDNSDLKESWISDKEYHSPMDTYGLSNSDFI